VTAEALERRVLVLAPTVRDAANTSLVLGRAGIAAAQCGDVETLCAELAVGAGAVIVTEETLAPARMTRLADFLRRQPKWSDLPFIAVTRGGPDSVAAVKAMETLGNVIVLERPVRMSTLVTAARTALRERERQYELRRVFAELQESDRRKDVFLAMLAHELRNPLAPIRNASEIFRRAESGNATLRLAGEIVDRQVTQLARLVDDLLDVSRITQGKVQLKRRHLGLQALMAQAIETAMPMIEAKHQELAIHLPRAPIHLDADPARLAQVIGNLLNNAAKYTSDGGRICVSARRFRDRAVVRVRDNGVGIAPAMLANVFDLFMQVDTSLDRSQGGLGIGLTLVRAIVELHGGGISARSAGLGRGSRFLFWLPALPGDATVPSPRRNGGTAVRERSPRRLLLVDDNVDAVESLAVLLRADGHDVRVAHDGPGALAQIESFRPHLVVLDIGLPGMNGYEIAQRIRARPELGAPTLVALTGYGQQEDRKRARAAGFDHHFIKPADVNALQRLLG
jgi:signal transduction histidine kinase